MPLNRKATDVLRYLDNIPEHVLDRLFVAFGLQIPSGLSHYEKVTSFINNIAPVDRELSCIRSAVEEIKPK